MTMIRTLLLLALLLCSQLPSGHADVCGDSLSTSTTCTALKRYACTGQPTACGTCLPGA